MGTKQREGSGALRAATARLVSSFLHVVHGPHSAANDGNILTMQSSNLAKPGITAPHVKWAPRGAAPRRKNVNHSCESQMQPPPPKSKENKHTSLRSSPMRLGTALITLHLSIYKRHNTPHRVCWPCHHQPREPGNQLCAEHAVAAAAPPSPATACLPDAPPRLSSPKICLRLRKGLVRMGTLLLDGASDLLLQLLDVLQQLLAARLRPQDKHAARQHSAVSVYAQGRGTHPSVTPIRWKLVVFGMQTRTLGPYSAAIHRTNMIQKDHTKRITLIGWHAEQDAWSLFGSHSWDCNPAMSCIAAPLKPWQGALTTGWNSGSRSRALR
jgi:hypothetical protein